MIGLSLLLTLIVYCWIAGTVSSRVSKALSRQAGIVVLLVFFLIPIVDAVIGRVALVVLCKFEGVPTINQIVHGVKGVGVDHSVDANSPSDYGIKYVEGDVSSINKHQLTRVTMSEDGLFYTKEFPVSAISPYFLRTKQLEYSTYFDRYRTSVIERKSGREIAGHTTFFFRGGWAERIVSLGNANSSCSRPGEAQMLKVMLQQVFPDAALVAQH